MKEEGHNTMNQDRYNRLPGVAGMSEIVEVYGFGLNAIDLVQAHKRGTITTEELVAKLQAIIPVTEDRVFFFDTDGTYVKIDLIKWVRSASGMGLDEAKAWVEANIMPKVKRAPPHRGGDVLPGQHIEFKVPADWRVSGKDYWQPEWLHSKP